ncbi:hypothetical protein [Tropicibacter oceani]|uniref:Uncharacterized protein n=1 Tax=Tropicibacter oceani TaxID=3058420 RepID=A0ABY8QI53_9RHOB|nr:hypothetical protein [Tropicibacter oceani]WGW04324.1 hypothetical protein QF118_01935 [Tropicibacter oceani]
MPLHILIALVLFGITGIAALTYLFGFAEPRRFDNTDAAVAAWLREFPDVPVHRVTLCQTGNAALVATPKGPGIVWAMGADSTARLLTKARLDPSPKGLTLRLDDYAAPRLSLRLTEAETRIWKQELGPFA